MTNTPSQPDDGANHRADDADRLLQTIVDELCGELPADARTELERVLAARPQLAATKAQLQQCVDALRESALDDPPSSAVREAVDRFRATTGAKHAQERPSWLAQACAFVAQRIIDSRRDVQSAGWRSSAAASDEVQLAFETDAVRIDLLATPVDEGTLWHLRGHLACIEGEPTEVVLFATSADAGEGTASPGPEDEVPFLRLIPLDGTLVARVVPGAYMLCIEIDDGARHVSAYLDLRSTTKR